jgi:molybdenum cofactor cytidylyltransferase
MKLHQAFNIMPGDVVALVGAGGKTSTMVSLGYELAEAGWRVLATTTTRIGQDQLELMPHALTPEAGSEAISAALTEDGFVFLYGSIRENKVYGPGPEWVPHLMDAVDSDVMLIEADGARGLPLKAPYDHEPVIPPETSLVIPVASLSALGQPLDDDHVYNAQAIIERYGFREGNTIKSPWMAQVLRDEQLGLRGIPPYARVIAFLNQVPSRGYERGRARLIARLALRRSRLHGVAIGSVRAQEPVHEVQRPIGAVVLAAGMSTRMGQSKVLLPWTANKTIIEHIVEQLINSRVDHIVVVTGHMAPEVKALLQPLDVKVVYNRSFKTGEMLSSLKLGLRALPENVAAALVVLGDQPRIQPKIIYQITMAYAEGKGEIVAPSFEMRRGHPILISRRYWPELLNLPRGSAPRAVINAHTDRIHHIQVDTDSVLRDVDTPQDYSEERWRAGL